MAEVLVQFDTPVRDEAGVIYDVRVCGRLDDDGLWEGWIEFDPRSGGTTLRSPRETKQPNRDDLEYWATGLTVSYFEGALDRALHPQREPLPSPDVRPSYDAPAPPVAGPSAESTVPAPAANAVLDPFEVYAQGEDLLRDELSALDDGHLRNIIRAYALADESVLAASADRPVLVELIVSAVQRRTR